MINATASSLEGQTPPVPVSVVSGATVCYDMMYGPSETAFVAWGRRLGARRWVDGLGMLVEQAAESFYIWRGVSPQTGQVLHELRAEMATNTPLGQADSFRQ